MIENSHSAGVVELVADHTVCTEGDQVSPEASRILVRSCHSSSMSQNISESENCVLRVVRWYMQRLLGVQMAAFRLHLICRWSPGDFEVYKAVERDEDHLRNGE